MVKSLPTCYPRVADRTVAWWHLIVIGLLALALQRPLMAQPAAGSVSSLACLQTADLGCGCYLHVQNMVCPSGPATAVVHFHTALGLQDPLHLQFDGADLELPHARHFGHAIKGDPAQGWTDEYASDAVRVRIEYVPGPSTCPKPAGETCEYSDYGATLVLERAGFQAQRFTATARCGC